MTAGKTPRFAFRLIEFDLPLRGGLPEDAWVSVADAAEYIGISKKMIQIYLDRGTLAGEQLPAAGGYRWLVSTDDLNHLKAERSSR